MTGKTTAYQSNCVTSSLFQYDTRKPYYEQSSPDFSGVRVILSFFSFMCLFCRSLFVILYFFFCVVCSSSIYGF